MSKATKTPASETEPKPESQRPSPQIISLSDLLEFAQLLSGPAIPPFVVVEKSGRRSLRRDDRRFWRVLILALILSPLGKGIAEKLAAGKISLNFISVLLSSTAVPAILLALLLIAALYARLMGPPFRITIEPGDCFQALHYLITPWIPGIMFIHKFLGDSKMMLSGPLFLLFFFVILPFLLIRNLSQGIVLISGAPRWRAGFSVMLPILGILASFFGWAYLVQL